MLCFPARSKQKQMLYLEEENFLSGLLTDALIQGLLKGAREGEEEKGKVG